MFGLPKTATAPFCPSEVRGSIRVDAREPFWRKLLKFAGPGLLVSVGYMDPGNWATDIEAGSKYGYELLFVVMLSSLAAIVLQCLSMRLGVVTSKDLARHSREQYPTAVNRSLWFLAELAIVACDLAEVLGTALAFHLLLGVSLAVGLALTTFDTLIVLGLKGKGFRQLEAIILGLIITIGGCFFYEVFAVGADWSGVVRGFVPSVSTLSHREPWYLAIGILGATVMPHNLYLHSSIVQTRVVGSDEASRRDAITLATWDTVISLLLAFLVNAAILILAASAFHFKGHREVTDIQDAYRLLDPLVGSGFGALLFGVALLASGQSSTFTGTIAGQVLMEGYLELKIPCWKRRVITRGLALVPAFIGVGILGAGAVGKMLVLSQVVLSFQLPFAIYPLLRFTGSRELMGSFVNGLALRTLGWTLFVVITAANLWLLCQTLF